MALVVLVEPARQPASKTTFGRRPAGTSRESVARASAHYCNRGHERACADGRLGLLPLVRSRRATGRHSGARIWAKASAGSATPSASPVPEDAGRTSFLLLARTRSRERLARGRPALAPTRARPPSLSRRPRIAPRHRDGSPGGAYGTPRSPAAPKPPGCRDVARKGFRYRDSCRWKVTSVGRDRCSWGWARSPRSRAARGSGSRRYFSAM
jgi:hypothetical protein